MISSPRLLALATLLAPVILFLVVHTAHGATRPTVRFTSAPTAVTSARSATLAIARTVHGRVRAQTCRFDRSAWKTCTRTLAARNLTDGPHTAQVRLVLRSGAKARNSRVRRPWGRFRCSRHRLRAAGLRAANWRKPPCRTFVRGLANGSRTSRTFDRCDRSKRSRRANDRHKRRADRNASPANDLRAPASGRPSSRSTKATTLRHGPVARRPGPHEARLRRRNSDIGYRPAAGATEWSREMRLARILQPRGALRAPPRSPHGRSEPQPEAWHLHKCERRRRRACKKRKRRQSSSPSSDGSDR